MRVVSLVRVTKYLKFSIIPKKLIKMEINCYSSKFNEPFVYGCADEPSLGTGNTSEDHVGL